ncbi:hypothetical protein [Paractinoplanes abujensis]|uniref:Uncharacterized protein n=1 Tax=Paractinoplanes abujensis TaxID=882441 RepID=A0A7W7CMS9_9ACTN|nr:hypothetical protein [Actinoplanes abujensis]MBB4691440.1 hypothetical protein [Actinoplanes abujensis]
MRWTPDTPPQPLQAPAWAVDPHTGATLTGNPPAPLQLTLPDGTTRPTTAEPHFTFSPGGVLFALHSGPPTIHLADATPQVINLPASAQESTIDNYAVWETKQHVLLPLTGTPAALRVDTETGECEVATMPAGILTHPLMTDDQPA